MGNEWIWRYKNVYYYYHYYYYYYYYYYYCYYLACFRGKVTGRRPIKCETIKFTRTRAREKASVNLGTVLESLTVLSQRHHALVTKKCNFFNQRELMPFLSMRGRSLNDQACTKFIYHKFIYLTIFNKIYIHTVLPANSRG